MGDQLMNPVPEALGYNKVTVVFLPPPPPQVSPSTSPSPPPLLQLPPGVSATGVLLRLSGPLGAERK